MRDILQDSSTTHEYTLVGSESAGTGPETIDTYEHIPWTAYANMNSSFSECAGGRTTSSITSTHTISSSTIVKVKVKWGVKVDIATGASANCGGYILWVEVYRGGAWEVVPGTSHNVHGCSPISYTEFTDEISGLSLTGVTKIRAYADAHGDKHCCAACGGSTQSWSSIFELQAYIGISADYLNSSGTVPTTGSTTDYENPLEVYSSSATKNQGAYALKVVAVGGAIIEDNTVTKTISSTDLSSSTYDTILMDVYALRTGTQFQFGMGEAAATDNLVNVTVAAANTWETVALDFSGVTDANKNAIIKIGLKITNADSGNIVYIDNIRPALTTATWTSPVLEINAGTFGQMYWNEILPDDITPTDPVRVYTRNAETAVLCAAAAWSDALTTPTGSDIVSTGASSDTDDMKFFQFKVVLVSNDDGNNYTDFPYLYQTDGYVIRMDYYKVFAAAESAVEFIYRTGYRNFDKPFEDKTYKKLLSWHKGSEGTFDLSYDIDYETGTSYSFDDISLSTYPNRYESFFPNTAFGRDIRVQWYKDDNYAFTIRQLSIIVQNEPIR